MQTVKDPQNLVRSFVRALAIDPALRARLRLVMVGDGALYAEVNAMLARAAVQDSLWPHPLAIGWQIVWVAVFIRVGARMFRRKVMKSGPRPVKKKQGRSGPANQPAM